MTSRKYNIASLEKHYVTSPWQLVVYICLFTFILCLVFCDFFSNFCQSNDRFDNLASLIEDKFSDVFSKLSNLESNATSLKSDIQTLEGRITAVEEELASKNGVIKNLFDHNSYLEKRLQELEAAQQKYVTKIEENHVAAKIILRGVPMDEEIDLSKSFETLCNTINCPNVKAENMFRLKTTKSSDQNSPVDAGIIIQLKSASEKVSLLKAAANFRKANKSTLLLEHAGIKSSAPLYLNECLTPIKKHILNAAVRLKKKNKFSAVFTLRGRIYFKIGAEDDPIEATSTDMLKDLFREVSN